MFRLMKYSIGKSHNEPFPGKSYGWRMAVSGAVDRVMILPGMRTITRTGTCAPSGSNCVLRGVSGEDGKPSGSRSVSRCRLRDCTPNRGADGGRTRLAMNALRRPQTKRRTTVFLIDLPSPVFFEQQVVCTAPTEVSTMVPYVYQSPCPVSVEPHGGNVKDHRSIEGKAIGNTRSLFNRLDLRGSD